MENESHTTVADLLSDGSLYEPAPAHLRARLQARLLEASKGQCETEDEADEADWHATTTIHVGARRMPRRTPDESAIDAPASARRVPGRIGWFLPQGARSRAFVGGVAAGVALSVMMGLTVLRSGMTPWLTSSSTPQFAQEIVSSHVRALISTRAIDVVSTDQHTVKPWFNGRINYAPPVVDTRSDGFPLVGGRLDYVGDRAVAVLVYRYLKHPIDLYVFPDTNGASGISTSTSLSLSPTGSPPTLSGQDTAAMPRSNTMSQQGYAIVEWHERGMVYWAITDASMVNLKLFADAVKRASMR